jgi:hypothetical protein
MEVYGKLGLPLGPAENAVEAGITEVWNLLVSGRLKVMASLTNWFREFRKYHRDDKGSGKIVKRDDHLMDLPQTAKKTSPAAYFRRREKAAQVLILFHARSEHPARDSGA